MGRHRELAAFARALDGMAGPRFTALELIGEPGVGKTRLLDELGARARQRRHLVLAGRATEFEQDLPLALVIDALDDQLGLEPAVLDELGAEGERLVNVFPGLRKSGSAADVAAADPGDSVGAASGPARYRFHRAVRSLLEVLARPSGLVLLLDDVHWADPASLDLLDHLLRHPPAGRVVIALAYRPMQVPPRLATATAGLPADRLRRLNLEPFTRAETEELLGPGVEAARQEHLYRLSGGNPLYLHALRHSESPPGSGTLTPDDPDMDTSIPPAVLAALAVELEAVPGAARLVVLAAAVAGNEFEPALVGAVAQTPAGAVLAALDDLGARDLVRPVPAAGRFRFRHPLIRHVAYAAARAGWRLAAHARAAGYLRGVGAPAEARAHHVARSADRGDLEAVTTLVEAGRQVAPRAPATAVSWLQVALRILPVGEGPLVPADPGVPSRLDLLGELSYCQGLSGNLSDGRDTLRTVLRLLPPGEHARRAEAVGRCASLERLLGEHAEAQALLRAELSRQPDPDSLQSGHLRLQLAQYRLLQGDFAGADALLARVAAIGGKHAVAPVIAAGLRAFTACASSRDWEAVPALPDAAATLIDSVSDATIARQIDTFTWLCWTELYLNHHGAALRHFTRCARVAAEAGLNHALPHLLGGRASAKGWLGELGEAVAVAEEAVATARMLGAAEPLAVALAVRSWVLCRTGESSDALEIAGEAVAVAEAGQGSGLVMARTAQALARMSAGEVDAAHLRLLDSCGGLDLPFLGQANRLTGFSRMAEADAARGDVFQARAWSERADRLADTSTDLGLGFARLTRAYALSVDAPAEAARCAVEAAGALERARARHEAGRAQLLAGSCHAAAGRRAAALAELRAAAEKLSRCGAGRLYAQATRLQRQLGARVAPRYPRDQGATHGLSRREAEVAALLRAGRTNQEIAEKLVLSVRTVETHVSRIYAKLNVTSRAAAASMLSHDL